MALTREYLTELGIDDNFIGSIMAEHGKSIQAEKQKTEVEKTRADNASGLLETANKKLEGYDPEWKTKMENAEKEAADKLNKVQFDFALSNALKDSGARNTKAVKALLKTDDLKLSDGKIIGFDEQIADIKKENDFLFADQKDDDNTPPVFTRSTNSGMNNTLGGDKKEQTNAAIRAAFGRH